MRVVRLLPLMAVGILVACIALERQPSESPLSPLSPLPPGSPGATPTTLPLPTYDPGATPPPPTFPPPPSPTPTTGILPILTPPKLREWPTATPTPLPAQAQRARQFAADQQGIPPERLEISWEQTVRLATTGEELWAGRFLDIDSGHYDYVWVDLSGHAGNLPDFSEQVVARIAEQESIPVEQLVVGSTGYGAYPFTKQIIWMAEIYDSMGEGIFDRVLDLEGNPADSGAIEAAERSAIERQCPRLEENLCRSFLSSSPEDLFYVWIDLDDKADLDVVAQKLEQAGYAYSQDDRRIRTRLPKWLILELTALEAVKHIAGDWPARTVPLNSNLSFTFDEADGQVNLRLSTEEYGCYNFQIDAELVHSEPHRFEIAIEGIHQPELCQEMVGPATWEATLGPLAGTYEMTFSYEDLRDRYRLIVAPESITAEPSEAIFTWPKYAAWLRLPIDAVWFVVQARTVDSEGTPIALERSTYEKEVGDFFAALENRGAAFFVPEEGVYSNRSFVPPWPNWWQSDGGGVEIPIDERSSLGFFGSWPDIRYFRHPKPDELIAFVRAFNSEGLLIAGHTWTGQSFLASD
jgi:hypothetical protein